MKIYSEITQKSYKTVDECLADEASFKEAEQQRKEAEEAKALARKDKAKEVEEAYKNYKQKLRDFCKEYGSYHMTVKSSDEVPSLYDLIEQLFNW